MVERDEHGTFVAGADLWLQRLGNLRNVVRQELVTRQLRPVSPDVAGDVLDVGAGQGTQAIALATLGHRVTAIEPDPRMREACGRALDELPTDVAQRVRVCDGAVEALPDTTYDLVLCHGVLMYLSAAEPAIAALAQRVRPGGWLSVVAVRWHGIRVASDDVSVDAQDPEDSAEIAALLDVEERLGATDPYRQLATLVHVLGRRG